VHDFTMLYNLLMRIAICWYILCIYMLRIFIKCLSMPLFQPLCFLCMTCMDRTRCQIRPSVCLSSSFNSRTAGRITMKFGTGIVPSRTISKLYVECPTIDSNKMVGEKIRKVGLSVGKVVLSSGRSRKHVSN
jgi:hypothetical protein